jgi:hypothetical protein
MLFKPKKVSEEIAWKLIASGKFLGWRPARPVKKRIDPSSFNGEPFTYARVFLLRT